LTDVFRFHSKAFIRSSIANALLMHFSPGFKCTRDTRRRRLIFASSHQPIRMLTHTTPTSPSPDPPSLPPPHLLSSTSSSLVPLLLLLLLSYPSLSFSSFACSSLSDFSHFLIPPLKLKIISFFLKFVFVLLFLLLLRLYFLIQFRLLLTFLLLFFLLTCSSLSNFSSSYFLPPSSFLRPSSSPFLSFPLLLTFSFFSSSSSPYLSLHSRVFSSLIEC